MDTDRLACGSLRGETCLARVFRKERHQGLTTTNDNHPGNRLARRRPAGADAGGIFPVGRLSKLVTCTHPDLDPGDGPYITDHLLELSGTG